MAQYLRVVKASRWDASQVTWLPAGQLKPEVFQDLKTNGEGCLSVFEVKGPLTETRIARAFAGTRDDVEPVEWFVIEGDDLSAVGLKVVSTPTNTPDKAVNASHHDVVHLSADGLLRFATVVARGRQDVMLAKRVKTLLDEGIADRTVDREAIRSAKLRDKLSA